jgi:hypothetical protein
MFDDIIGKPTSHGSSSGMKDKYLNNPDFCPYCGDDRFEVDDWNHLMDVGTKVDINVRCMACGKSWIDTVELTENQDVDIIDVRFL